MTADATEPISREAFCPSCDATVQLDEEQLIHKRATCGACQAEFEVVPELFGRTRSSTALVPVTTPGGAALAVADPPPSPAVSLTNDGSLLLRPTRTPARTAILGVGAALGMVLLLPMGATWLGLAYLCVLAALLAMVFWPWPTRIRVQDGDLVVSHGPFDLPRTRLPLADIDEVSTRAEVGLLSSTRTGPHHVLQIARVSDFPVDVGARLANRNAQDMQWAGRQVTRMIRQGRTRLGRTRGPR